MAGLAWVGAQLRDQRASTLPLPAVARGLWATRHPLQGPPSVVHAHSQLYSFLPLHPLGLAPQLQFYAPNSLSHYLPRHHSFFNLLLLLRIPFLPPLLPTLAFSPQGQSPHELLRPPQLSRRGLGQSMLILGLQVEPPGFHLKAALRPPVTWSTWPDNCGPS